jgi:hypothetical protein
MSSNPYENEPGFEGTKITDKEAEEYAQKVCPIYSAVTSLSSQFHPSGRKYIEKHGCFDQTYGMVAMESKFNKTD